MSAAARAGQRVLVQCSAHVSASRAHRKYDGLTVTTLDAAGRSVRRIAHRGRRDLRTRGIRGQVLHKGSDGRENQWEDLLLLNYRKLETWERTIAELDDLATSYEVRGAFVYDAQVRATACTRRGVAYAEVAVLAPHICR